MSDTIRIDTEHAVSISTSRPVSIKTEGGETTITVEATRPEPRSSGLATPVADRSGELTPRPGKRFTAMTEIHDTPSPVGETPRCSVLMPRSKKLCARPEGHNGAHMSREQIDRKQSYNRDRARERYNSDPDYAERAKAQSRASHQKTKEATAAT